MGGVTRVGGLELVEDLIVELVELWARPKPAADRPSKVTDTTNNFFIKFSPLEVFLIVFPEMPSLKRG